MHKSYNTYVPNKRLESSRERIIENNIVVVRVFHIVNITLSRICAIKI